MLIPKLHESIPVGYIMTTLKFITSFLLIAIYSCGHHSAKNTVDPAAVELNNKAMTLVAFIDNADSSNKAIILLNKATTIDSNYFLGHYNKLLFFNQLKQFDKAVLTVNKLIQLRPSAQDLYLTGGILYERIGDTVSSKQYFTKSLTICTAVLDTMSVTNRDYDMLLTNKAANLIMLGYQQQANEILKKLYDKQTDEELKMNTLLMMNKSKKQLLEFWTGNQ
jgi:tetratricopeptide (TPR) repeat protein